LIRLDLVNQCTFAYNLAIIPVPQGFSSDPAVVQPLGSRSTQRAKKPQCDSVNVKQRAGATVSLAELDPYRVASSYRREGGKHGLELSI
jgi:hypothetical protein